MAGSAPGTPDSAHDIQYACIFPRLGMNGMPPDPKNAMDPCNGAQGAFDNDCSGNTAALNNPLCVANPNDNMNPTFQLYAKAYPGVRNLAIVKGMHLAQKASGIPDTGIVGSICAAQLTENTQPDYGYLPAVQAIVGRLSQALGTPCLGRSIPPNPDGTVPCVMLEATPMPPSGTCGSCSSTPLRTQVPSTPEGQGIVYTAIQQDPAIANECVCEVSPATGATLTACQNRSTGTGVDGWCYIDATVEPPIGNAQLVQSCPSTEKREVRFVGLGTPQPGATTLAICEGQ